VRIRSAKVYRYRLPLRAPLRLRDQTIVEREGLLLRLESDTGHVGWGDAAPLPAFSRETCDDAEQVLLRCARRLAGFDTPDDYAYFEGAEIAKTDDMASVGFAVESAYFGLHADRGHTPLYKHLRSSASTRVRLNALLSGDEEFVLAEADRLKDTTFSAAKLKVGRNSIEEDAAIVMKVRELLPPPFRLRLDANRAWDFDTARAFASRIHAAEIDYLEEPLRDPFQLPEWLEATQIPFALDETLHEFHLEVQRNFSRQQIHSEEFIGHIKQLLTVFRAAEAVV